MKEIIKRLKSETPLFFKRVRYFGLSLSAAGTSIVIIDGIPDEVKVYAGKAIWIGAVIAIVAQMASANPEELK
jgi:hypothetical protein